MRNLPLNARRSSQRGFTLTEVIFVLFIASFVSLGLFFFIKDTSKLMFVSTEKLEMVADIRQITSTLADRAREANEFYVYTRYSPGALDSDDLQGEGGKGDCLVLLYTEPRDIATGAVSFSGAAHIMRIGVFYREEVEDGNGPVKFFEIDYSSTGGKRASANTVEGLVNAYNGNSRVIVQLAKGLADKSLFYQMNKESVLVKAEIFHGNNAKKVTNTYNFTISPRG